MDNSPKERVITYIDGYNLYFGLKDSGFDRYKWLNIETLVQRIIRPNQSIQRIKYFTTLVTNNSDARNRQKTYIKALESLDCVDVLYGKFHQQLTDCDLCGQQYYKACEKMTDVGIATAMISDAYENKFDVAMLISGDTDILPPIRHIHRNFENKRVFVAFPPNRQNDEVKDSAKGVWVIGRANLSQSQFPDTVTTRDGEQIFRPESWK